MLHHEAGRHSDSLANQAAQCLSYCAQPGFLSLTAQPIQLAHRAAPGRPPGTHGGAVRCAVIHLRRTCSCSRSSRPGRNTTATPWSDTPLHTLQRCTRGWPAIPPRNSRSVSVVRDPDRRARTSSAHDELFSHLSSAVRPDVHQGVDPLMHGARCGAAPRRGDMNNSNVGIAQVSPGRRAHIQLDDQRQRGVPTDT